MTNPTPTEADRELATKIIAVAGFASGFESVLKLVATYRLSIEAKKDKEIEELKARVAELEK